MQEATVPSYTPDSDAGVGASSSSSSAGSRTLNIVAQSPHRVGQLQYDDDDERALLIAYIPRVTQPYDFYASLASRLAAKAPPSSVIRPEYRSLETYADDYEQALLVVWDMREGSVYYEHTGALYETMLYRAFYNMSPGAPVDWQGCLLKRLGPFSLAFENVKLGVYVEIGQGNALIYRAANQFQEGTPLPIEDRVFVNGGIYYKMFYVHKDKFTMLPFSFARQ